MSNSRIKLDMPSFDDIFKTGSVAPAPEDGPRTACLPIGQIKPFPGHPFRVDDDEDMDRLVRSISEQGLITPLTVREKGGGEYELISGHRRKRACEILGLEEARCEIVELSDEEAVIQMVESNYHRSDILPSEKAFAYKMRLDAVKELARRGAAAARPLGGRSAAVVSGESGESERQIHRYIRLTSLVPELLELVDSRKLNLRAAVDLSYLDEASQRSLHEVIKEAGSCPSMSQAKSLREMYESGGTLEPSAIRPIMDSKPVPATVSIRRAKIKDYLPEGMAGRQAEEYIVRALEFYSRSHEGGGLLW